MSEYYKYALPLLGMKIDEQLLKTMDDYNNTKIKELDDIIEKEKSYLGTSDVVFNAITKVIPGLN